MRLVKRLSQGDKRVSIAGIAKSMYALPDVDDTRQGEKARMVIRKHRMRKWPTGKGVNEV